MKMQQHIIGIFKRMGFQFKGSLSLDRQSHNITLSGKVVLWTNNASQSTNARVLMHVIDIARCLIILKWVWFRYCYYLFYSDFMGYLPLESSSEPM